MKKTVSLFISIFMLLGIIMPFNALAYTTNATVNNGEYAVYDHGVAFGPGSTSVTTLALKEMRRKALLRFTIPGTADDYYYPVESDLDIINDLIVWKDSGCTTKQQYRGIIYQQKSANKNNINKPSREHWLSSGTDITNAITTMYGSSGSDRHFIKGTDCSSSACYSWRVGILGSDDRSNGTLMSSKSHNGSVFCTAYTSKKIFKDGNDFNVNNEDGYGNYIDLVGNYTPNGDYTNEILHNLGADVYENVYAFMQPGDFLVQYASDGRKHVRLVEKVVIIRNSDNSINKYRSYVVVTEQARIFKNCTNNAYSNIEEKYYKTTWYVGYAGGEYTSQSGNTYHNYNFLKLAGRNTEDNKTYYIPYRYNGTTAYIITGFVLSNINKNEIEIKWNEQNPDYCNGYEVVYATNSEFDDAKTVVFNSSRKNSYVLKNLENGKTYYIKMRSYLFKDGIKEYSGYNNWLRINTETKEIYRQNAPNPKDVSPKEYKEYIYDDISYDYEFDN